MSGKNVFVVTLVLIVGFAIGFFVANSVNRGEVEELKRLVEQAGNVTESQNNEMENSLSDEEIHQKIEEADRNPRDVRFQANLGIALYRYGSMKRDVNLIREAGRLLERANTLEEKNFDILAGLGGVNFDLAYIGEESEKFGTSRDYYRKASDLRPEDSTILTNIGLTYFLSRPPNLELAANTFEQTLKSNPKDERALEYVVRSLAGLKRQKDAAHYFEELRKASPAYPAIKELQALISVEAYENR